MTAQYMAKCLLLVCFCRCQVYAGDGINRMETERIRMLEGFPKATHLLVLTVCFFFMGKHIC